MEVRLKSYKEMAEETGLAVDRMKSLVRYHNLPTDYEKRPGQGKVVVLPIETENFIKQFLQRSDARKRKIKDRQPITLAFINQMGGVAKSTKPLDITAGLLNGMPPFFDSTKKDLYASPYEGFVFDLVNGRNLKEMR